MLRSALRMLGSFCFNPRHVVISSSRLRIRPLNPISSSAVSISTCRIASPLQQQPSTAYSTTERMSSRQDVQTKRVCCGTHRRTSAPPSGLHNQPHRRDEPHQFRNEPSNSNYDAMFDTVDYMASQEDPTRAARNSRAMVGQQPRTLAVNNTKSSTSFKHRACLPKRLKDQTTGSSTKEDMVDDWVLVSEDEDWDIIPHEK
ncbi:hypothetical protein GE09DRAFT_1089454 [Coniochaeta sp. 2T2.1]|nr:hypothetical protein GE09DRAFT_1089454 [Coniochaeta sp. 2T2.1]